MNTISMSDAAYRAVAELATLPFRWTGTRQPDGSWLVPVEDDIGPDRKTHWRSFFPAPGRRPAGWKPAGRKLMAGRHFRFPPQKSINVGMLRARTRATGGNLKGTVSSEVSSQVSTSIGKHSRVLSVCWAWRGWKLETWKLKNSRCRWRSFGASPPASVSAQGGPAISMCYRS